jgi:hypothetical protein
MSARCEHGRVAESCPFCPLVKEIEELRGENEQLRATLERIRAGVRRVKKRFRQ